MGARHEQWNGDPTAEPTKSIWNVRKAANNPLMTMMMLSWLARGAELALPPKCCWSFSVAKYSSQCSV
jgi:hypothetical protein